MWMIKAKTQTTISLYHCESPNLSQNVPQYNDGIPLLDEQYLIDEEENDGKEDINNVFAG